MTIFEDNFTNILKEMDKKAEELFPLNENVLKETFLTNDKKILLEKISVIME